MSEPAAPRRSPSPTASSRGLAGCTLSSPEDLALAVVAASSFLEHHPDAGFRVVVTSALPAPPELPDDRIELLLASDLDVGRIGGSRLLCSFGPADAACVARPSVVRALLEEHDAVVLIDPSSLVLADLEPMVPTEAATGGWTIAPMRLSPLPADDGCDLDADEWAGLPLFDAGCMGFDRRSAAFLDWWEARSFEDPRLDRPSGGLVTDRWVDVGVSTFGAHVVRDPGVGIGFWNADERPLVATERGTQTCGHPARLLHLTSFDATRPWLLAAHHARRPRVSMSDAPVLAELLLEHRRRVDAVGRLALDGRDPMDDAVGGLAPVVRAVFHHDTVAALRGGGALPPTPLDGDGGAGFREWLGSSSDTPGDVPLIAYAAWCARPDVQAQFPDLSDPNVRDDFIAWIGTSAADEHPEVDWDRLQVPAYEPATFVRVSSEPFGVDVVGYLAGGFGLGEAGRRLTMALEAAGVPVSTVAYREVDQRMWDGYRTDDVFRHDTVVLAVNAPETPRIHAELRDRLRNRYLIGYWHWEVLHSLPDEHRAALPLVDEIWAPSTFVAGLFEPYAPGRVAAMPYPLAVEPLAPRLGRAAVGFDDRFTFLCVFDFYSSSARKNPHALVDAFRLAFEDGEGPVLFLKTINGRKPIVAGELEALRWAARGRSDIVISDVNVEPHVVRSMIGVCDCYVSLHRSEGVGSTLSDAMASGRPVVATRFSGNLDFMTDATAHLVDTRGLRRVGGADYRAYPEEGIWAEPDVDRAAGLLRQVYDDPGAAARRGQAAAVDLAARWSPEITGRRMRERLEAIGHERAGRGRAPAPRATLTVPDEGAEPPIAIMSFDRPHLLARVLESLRAQSSEVADARVHLFQDGAVSCYSGRRHAADEDVEACVELFRAAFPGGHVHRSHWNVGVAEAYLAAESVMFQGLGAPVALFFEDDLELAPHYLQALAMIWEAVRDEPRIGYFNAMGPHFEPLERQAAVRTSLGRMHHNWGFGLRRDHWLRISPLMSDYYRLVVGRDYRHRPEDEIRALLRSWGVPMARSSQDAAKDAATLAVGGWKVASGPCLGRYLGERGLHSTPELFARGRWADTQLWMDPLPRPCPPGPDEIDAKVRRAIEQIAEEAARA